MLPCSILWNVATTQSSAIFTFTAVRTHRSYELYFIWTCVSATVDIDCGTVTICQWIWLYSIFAKVPFLNVSTCFAFWFLSLWLLLYSFVPFSLCVEATVPDWADPSLDNLSSFYLAFFFYCNPSLVLYGAPLSTSSYSLSSLHLWCFVSKISNMKITLEGLLLQYINI